MPEMDMWTREQRSKMALYGISCTQLARELGISNSHLSQIFRGSTIKNGARGGEGARGGCSRAKVQETISMMIDAKKSEAEVIMQISEQKQESGVM